ncbi:hypothetical protein SGRA_3952 [Saprospira grandis str. Lewin]|uniref:Uncharacterized protein n=1 Tax=Saprospira grandis (strain Lewin) TaxID=984262 RepID=H6L776_SAPGL|nr:hypothetical protein SGRA_3952 [Saprospira grandis str. Lewin]
MISNSVVVKKIMKKFFIFIVLGCFLYFLYLIFYFTFFGPFWKEATGFRAFMNFLFRFPVNWSELGEISIFFLFLHVAFYGTLTGGVIWLFFQKYFFRTKSSSHATRK